MSDYKARNASPAGRHLAPAADEPARRGTASRRGETEPRRSRATARQAADQRGETEPRPGRAAARQAADQRGETEPRRSRAAARQAADRAGGTTRAGRRRRKWFRTCLLVYLAILGVCTGYLQIKLWLFLYRSQAEMDRQAAELAERVAQQNALYRAPQLAFEDWLNGRTADYWTDLWYTHGTNELEPRQRVSEYLGGLFAPDAAQAYKDVSFTDQTPVYLIKNGEQPLARVTVTGQDLAWSVSDVELLVTGDKTVSVTAPTSCIVSFNGIQLDERFRQPADSLLLYEPIKGQLETPVTWMNYTVEGLLADPVITVTPPEGFETLQNADGDYLITLPEGHVGDYPEHTVNFVRAFLNYYMNGYSGTRGHMNTVLSYLRKDTQAYQDILDTYDSVNWASNYSNIDTTKTYAGDVIVWSNNCFSIDVTYDADATMLGEAVDYANATMRVYYMKSDSGYYISHFETL